MLIPSKTKYKKQMKGRNKGMAQRGNDLVFGSVGIQAINRGFLTSRQIEAARRAVSRYVKRGGKMWIRVFPDKPITMRPAETRMGKGKGSVDHYVSVIKPGRIIFEIDGIQPEVASDAFRLAQYKLPRGDRVQVISGKHKGKVGKILRIDREKMRVYVEGVNMQKRHTKPTQQNQLGSIREKEGAVHYSNILLYCPKSEKGERINIVTEADGTKKRQFVKSGTFAE
ncbi:hypothetical protein CHS0354_027355 [Potamilus streckersoni]|uniref:Large ribosomal subunit protein uL16m n=1 Tax=Potamilus streckersoni TaxID=2493646 RepID=A0AAE0W0R8_9BIVA|nr:hypothetical protein CHS0354_027355 [Potamilus streckersoni]